MKEMHPLAGIYVASVTPLNEFDTLDIASVPTLLRFFAERGCHGALLQGTSGEGTSMSVEERISFWEAAKQIRSDFPEFRLLAATGTPSLAESIALTKAAFSAQMDAVVVLPPFFFRNASVDGLFNWYSQLIDNAVPEDKFLLGYHIPQVSGVALSFELLERLNQRFPTRFAGLKDSSADLKHAEELVQLLPGKAILVGNDHLLAPSLKFGASGAITALANLCSPLMRKIWEAHKEGSGINDLQEQLSASRKVLDSNPAAQSFLKALLHELHGFPVWHVRAPLENFDDEQVEKIASQFNQSLL